jgi:chromosome segregation ATPase
MSPTEYEQLVEFLGRKFTEIDRRFDQIDGRFAQIALRFDHIAGRFDQNDHRFDQLDGKIADLRREMLGHFDEIYRRLDRLEQEYQAITQALRRIEAGLADEIGRREILTRDLAELKHQVAALQFRIADIEQRLGH